MEQAPAAERRARYERDGFVFSEPLVTPDLLARVVTHMDAVIAGSYETGVPPHARHFGPEDPPQKLRKIDQPHLSDRTLYEFVTHPAVGAWVAELLEADWIQVWATQLLVKPPGGQVVGNVGWHQDSAYWPYWEGEVFTVWVAISHITPESGPMRYLRGSHRWGVIEGSDFFNPNIQAGDHGLSLPAGADWEEVPALLPPGAVSLHHRLTLHASGPNTAKTPRRSFALHMRTDRSRPLESNFYTDHLDDPLHAPVIYRKSPQ